MHCLHPRTKIYIDPITGERKEVLIPCGHCINCLHEFQDMWTIRLFETAKSSKYMIFDTLTISPYRINTKIDFLKPTSDNKLYGTTSRYAKWKIEAIKNKYSSFKRYYPSYSKETYYTLKKNSFKVFDFPKEEVQKWIKRGREMFQRDKGVRCDISYFLVEEYGPLTSRPHFHVLFFGLNYSDYMHYFGNPWREDFGWTKPTFKQFDAASQKDFNNMLRYVCKYVSKGVFESPFVKDRLLPKPYRLISKGIGEGYLSQDFFKVFKAPEFQLWMKYHKPSEDTYKRVCSKLEAEEKWDKLAEYKKYYSECCSNVEFALQLKAADRFQGVHQDYIDLSHITDKQLKSLQVYYDNGGFPHSLPQYYKNKLFRKNNEKNIYQFEIQNLLQQSALLHDNQVIQEEALTMGIYIPDAWLTTDSSTWGLSPSTLFMVNFKHSVAKKNKNKIIAEGRYSKLKNFYNRSKMNKDAPALL